MIEHAANPVKQVFKRNEGVPKVMKRLEENPVIPKCSYANEKSNYLREKLASIISILKYDNAFVRIFDATQLPI